MWKGDVISLSQSRDIIGQRQRVFVDIIKVPNHLTLNKREIILGMPDLINNLFKGGVQILPKVRDSNQKRFSLLLALKKWGTGILQVHGNEFCHNHVSMEEDLRLQTRMQPGWHLDHSRETLSRGPRYIMPGLLTHVHCEIINRCFNPLSLW